MKNEERYHYFNLQSDADFQNELLYSGYGMLCSIAHRDYAAVNELIAYNAENN